MSNIYTTEAGTGQFLMNDASGNMTWSDPVYASTTNSVYDTWSGTNQWNYTIKVPNPNEELPETLKQITDHTLEECWKDSRVKCFSSREELYSYIDSLEYESTVFFHEEISKKVKPKTILHVFKDYGRVGLILSGDSSEIFFVKDE